MKTIQTEKYLLLCDETAEIKEGNWFVALDETNDIYKANTLWVNICKDQPQKCNKILASSPKLGDLPEFETLPPNIEDDVEKLALNFAKTPISNHKEQDLNTEIWISGARQNGFIAGYKQAKFETMFSLDDIENTYQQGFDDCIAGKHLLQTYKDIITKPKQYEFIPKMEFIEDDDDYFNDEETGRSNQQPKIINNKIQGTWKLKTN
jgi:hypothetical protein